MQAVKTITIWLQQGYHIIMWQGSKFSASIQGMLSDLHAMQTPFVAWVLVIKELTCLLVSLIVLLTAWDWEMLVFLLDLMHQARPGDLGCVVAIET